MHGSTTIGTIAERASVISSFTNTHTVPSEDRFKAIDAAQDRIKQALAQPIRDTRSIHADTAIVLSNYAALADDWVLKAAVRV